MKFQFIHYITSKCSEKDYSELSKWAKENPQDFKRHAELYHVYMMAKATTISQKDTDAAFERLKERMNTAPVELKLTRSWWKRRNFVASVILFLTLIGTALGWKMFNNNSANSAELVSVCTNASNVKNVILPDGTSVWLNKNSELTYPKTFSSNTREVQLKGEGYFHVVKNPHHPFVVHNQAQDIKVLGTVFYASNNPSTHQYIVSLIKGSVEVKNMLSNNSVRLLPGQRAVANDKDGLISVSEIPTGNDVLWHHEILSFKKSTLNSIMATLEKIYGIDIKVKALRHRSNTYSGEIAPRQNIENTLKLLQLTLPFSYKKQKSDSNNSYFEITSK